MTNKFAQVAIRRTTLSQLMNGRDKLKIDELIEKYPEGVTVVGFDIVTAGADTYPVFIFEEDNSKFVNGGAIMHDICEGWVELCDGDIEIASASLANAGGVKIRFEKSITKTGRNVTLPIILDQ